MKAAVGLASGRSLGARRWRRRWEAAFSSDGVEVVNADDAAVVLARSVDQVGAGVCSWWLDGDVLASDLGSDIPPIPARVRRIITSRETGRQTILATMPDRADQVVSAGDVALIGMVEGSTPVPIRSPRTVLVAGHDFRFFEPIAADLVDAGHQVIWDEWRNGTDHDEARSRELLSEADTVVCEWALGNAVWYSENLSPGQRLIVRLHRYELDRPFGANVKVDSVSVFVVVSGHMGEWVRVRFGWPAERIEVIPNGVDVVALLRPKDPRASRRLGMVGYGTPLKRFDLALDLVEALRRHDPRFLLRVKGRPPERLPWVWDDPAGREGAVRQRERLEEPALAGALDVADYTPGLSEWLRGVGFILSLSDVESFHLALGEGMAAETVPVILRRPGAEDLWGRRWLHDGIDSATEAILGLRPEHHGDEGLRARTWVQERYSRRSVSSRWGELI